MISAYGNSICRWLNAGIILLAFQDAASAKEYFNPQLLDTSSTAVPQLDLSLFAQEDVPPGEYNIDIYINGKYIDTRTLTFQQDEDEHPPRLRACLSTSLLKQWGIRVDQYPKLQKNDDHCAALKAIPEATEKLDIMTQRYVLSVPQIAMLNVARGYVAESRWDDGITAGLLNYSLTGQQTTSRTGGDDDRSQFLSVQPGINIGAWRLRNYSTYSHDGDEQRWESMYTSVSRDIRFLKSQLVMGEANTRADIFDSISFTGALLYSDTEMLPDSRQGFAPVIRGIAQSNAEVSVLQNGYVIYKTTVSPGSFEIKDIYPTGSSGDLYVNVKESDGSERRFIVPYASLAIMQREGQGNYSVAAGKTRHQETRAHEFNFVQGAGAWGLRGGFTAYAGFIQAEDQYSNVLVGTGMNIGGLGALSFDLSQSWAQLPREDNSAATSRESGQSYRLRYSKMLQQTDTSLSIAGYRYSTGGYYAFSDFTDAWNTEYQRSYDGGRTRDRVDISISQNLPLGSLVLSLVSESYWDTSRTDSLSLGYSGAIGGISYFANYAYSKNVSDDDEGRQSTRDNVFSLSFRLPFSVFSQDDKWRSVSASYAINHSDGGSTSHNLGLSGSLLRDNALNWQLSEGYDAEARATSGNLNVGYQSRYADLAAGFGYDEYSRRFSYGIRGGAVAHSKGLTLSRSLNESVALVQAPGVAGVPVSGQTNVYTDGSGNAVIPYARPYHLNNVRLDSRDMAIAEVDIDNQDKNVVPTRGAVVVAKYKTWVGYKAMMTLRYRGRAVPFGAVVSLSNQEDDATRTNIVGDDGQVYLVGLGSKGSLQVKWGESADKRCQVDYVLPEPDVDSPILFYTGECRPVS